VPGAVVLFYEAYFSQKNFLMKPRLLSTCLYFSAVFSWGRTVLLFKGA
jgi:hypothetical protein